MVRCEVPFVILATQRSGSTWVVDMLNSHSRIAAYSELFLQDGRGRPKWGGSKEHRFWNEFWLERRRANPHADLTTTLQQYLDELFAKRSRVDAIGFKLMYGQLGAWPPLLELLQSSVGVRVIHLIRRNVLDIIVSKTLAAERGIFHSRGMDPLPPETIRLDPCSLIPRLEWETEQVEKMRNIWSTGPCSYVEAIYEELRDDPERFAELPGFLDVPVEKQGFKSVLQRVNPMAQCDVIENYSDVKTALAGTQFVHLLD